MRNIFDEKLLNKEVTRKEFLQYIAGFALTAVGASDFIERIWRYNSTADNHAATAPQPESRHGFGASKFGV